MITAKSPPFTPAYPWGRGQGRRREQQHTEPEEACRAYRARNHEQQREYNRIKARQYRARKKAQAATSAQ